MTSDGVMNLENSNIGFIGAGNMANALIRGLLVQGAGSRQLLAADIDADKLQKLKEDCGIQIASSGEIAEVADVIVLAVKPQVMKAACQQIEPFLRNRNCLLVSIAAGITCQHLQSWLGTRRALVRCMPNTPALVARGATALYANNNVTAEQRALAEAIMAAVGIALWVEDEGQIDAVTALSGSGPAYFFLLMEAMQEAAIDLGMDAETARRLTLQTALGAAELADSSSATAAELRRQVTSPGGTTEQALLKFEEGGLRELVTRALMAAQNRSRELARDFGEE